MAYAVTNPPRMVAQPIAGLRQWQYTSTDAQTVVRVAGYITNGYDLGMKAGDLVWVVDNDAAPPASSLHTVASVTTNGAADLSDSIFSPVTTNTD